MSDVPVNFTYWMRGAQDMVLTAPSSSAYQQEDLKVVLAAQRAAQTRANNTGRPVTLFAADAVTVLFECTPAPAAS